MRCKKICLSAFLFFIIPLLAGTAQATPQSVNHTFADCISWNYDGKPTPNTYWSPNLPIFHQIVRFKLGFRFSTGTIALKNSVNLNFSWNEDESRAGNTLRLRIKPTLTDESYNTFESSFGVMLPNEIQAGFIGVAGLPDILPWYTLPLDFWQMVGMIPKVGAHIASAEDQIGVNMSSKSGLPLGTSKSYHDTRDLISLNLGQFLSGATKTKAINDIWSKISGTKRATLIAAIKIAKDLSDSGAEDFIKELIGKGIGKVADAASLTVVGDPSYKLTGQELLIHLRYWVPGKMSGNYPIYLTSDSEFDFDIPLPIFINEGDKLYVTVENIGYRFKLEQHLKFGLGISALPTAYIIDSEKIAAYTQTEKPYTPSDFQIQIPILESDQAILDYHVTTGSVSATARWASPDLPLKGTVKLYRGNQLIEEKTEPSFRTSHHVQFIDLTPDTEYRFVMTCVDSSGNFYPERTFTARTEEEGVGRVFTDNTSQAGAVLSSARATATQTAITFTWTTNVPASTEVFFGASPDLGENYIGAFKKSDGTVETGYFGSASHPSEREITTQHSITVPGLEPGTTYYYQIISWTFKNNDPTDNPQIKLGYLGNIKTQPMPEPPSLAIEVRNIVGGGGLADIPVTITKQGAQSGQTLITGPTGVTPQVILEKGKTYSLAVAGHPAYQDKTVQFSVASGQVGLMPNRILQIDRKPSPGGLVLDQEGNPISGAIAKIFGTSLAVDTATTDASGRYTFEGVEPGGYGVHITKENYLRKEISGTSDSFQMFSAPPAILSSGLSTLNISVTADGTVAGGVEVQVEQMPSGPVLADLVTDAQGMASVEIFVGSPIGSIYRIKVKESAALNFMDTYQHVRLEPGASQDVSIDCEVHTVPAIEGFRIEQTHQQSLRIGWGMPAGRSARHTIAYYKPDGTLVERPWTDGFATSASHFISGNDHPAGLYRIKGKNKDYFGNIVETDFVEFLLFKDESLGVSVSEITADSAKLSWNLYPHANFGYYRIGDIQITDQNATSYVLTGLTPNRDQGRTIRLFDNNPGVQRVIAESTVSFKTLPPAATISNFTLSPSFIHLGGEVGITAQIANPGSHKRRATLYLLGEEKQPIYEEDFQSTSFNINTSLAATKEGKQSVIILVENVDAAGQASDESFFTVSAYEKPLIGIIDVPSKVLVNEGFDFLLTITNAEKSGHQFEYSIDWGDGKSDRKLFDTTARTKRPRAEAVTAVAQAALKYAYSEEGDYVINISVASLVDEKEAIKIVSDPLTLPLQVGSRPPVIEFSREEGDSAAQTFSIKAQSGSHAITSWNIKFGNGKEESGSGDVEKNVHSTYAKGDYGAVFTATDVKDNVYTKNLSFRVRQDIKDISAADLVVEPRPGEPPKQTEEKPAAEIQPIKEKPAITRKPPPDKAALEDKPEEKTEEIRVDLSVERIDISARQRELFVGDKIEFTVTLKNNSAQQVSDVLLNVQSDDGFREAKRRINLRPNASERFSFVWAPEKAGVQMLTATLEHKDDFDPRNNRLSERVEVKEKQPELRIRISNIELEGERRGIIEAGRPLNVILSIDSSIDFEGKCDVNFSIRSKNYRDRFSHKIRGLRRGSNEFQFMLLRELKPDTYELSVEVSNRNLNLRETARRDFQAVER